MFLLEACKQLILDVSCKMLYFCCFFYDIHNAGITGNTAGTRPAKRPTAVGR